MSSLFKWLFSSSQQQQQQQPEQSSIDQSETKCDLSKQTRPFPSFSDNSKVAVGLENFGNTCFCNAVLQSLFHSRPFRDRIFSTCAQGLPSSSVAVSSSSAHHRNSLTVSTGESAATKPNILSALKELFVSMHNTGSNRRVLMSGTVSPREFIRILRQENALFRSPIQHDAHEFLNYLMNAVCDIVMEQHKLLKQVTSEETCLELRSSEDFRQTWIHDLFEGKLANQTRCLCCETISHRIEPFLDLSVDIPCDNCSVTACLRHFSKAEILSGRDKFFCEVCNSYQEAEKTMVIRRLPRILALHLKRFKYSEQLNRYTKLCHRVSFPLELRLAHDDSDGNHIERSYRLFSIIVHVGNDISRGHYISLARSTGGKWNVFDDTFVDSVEENLLPQVFGNPSPLLSFENETNASSTRSSSTDDITDFSDELKSRPYSASFRRDFEQMSQKSSSENLSEAKQQQMDQHQKSKHSINLPMTGFGFMNNIPLSSLEQESERRSSSPGHSNLGNSFSPKRQSSRKSLLPYGSGYILFYETISEG